MVRIFTRFLFLILITLISIIIYLSYFGIETDKFNSIIKNKANEVAKNAKLEFQNTKIHINIKELNLAVKLQNPKILIKNNEIILSKIDLFLPLKSFITSDFLLKRAEIAFFNNNIKDLVKISNLFLPRFINKRLNKILSSGNLQGEFVIPFNSDGSLAENYEISAKLLNANLNINKDLQISNLSTDIKYIYNSKKNKEINFFINQGKFLNLDLKKSFIDIHLKDKIKLIKSKIKTSGISKYPEIKIISSLLGLKLNNIKNLELKSDLETSIKLSLDNKFKLIEKEFSLNGKIADLNLKHEKVKVINNFFPSYNSNIFLKDTEISFKNTNSQIKLLGLIKFEEKFEDFSLTGRTEPNFNLNVKINLNELSLKIPKLNYSKKKNTNADLNFKINESEFGYNIPSLLYSSGKSKIELEKVKLNKKLEIKDLKNIKIVTFNENNKNLRLCDSSRIFNFIFSLL